MNKFFRRTVQLVFIILVSTPIVAMAQSDGMAGDSYRNVARQAMPTAEPTGSMNPFSKLKDFSFKRPQANGPSFFNRLENLSPFNSANAAKEQDRRFGTMSASSAAGFRHFPQQQAQTKSGLGKLFPPRNPTEPGWLNKVNTKTRDFFSRSTAWARQKEKMPPNWEQTRQEIQQLAYDVMRDAKPSDARPVATPQPPLRSANLNQPNVRY
jgi:hypothetical protein